MHEAKMPSLKDELLAQAEKERVEREKMDEKEDKGKGRRIKSKTKN